MPQDLSEHIVKSYDEQLKRLRELVVRMGGLAERQLADSTTALMQRNAEFAGQIIERDAEINALEREIEAFCIQLLALRQPVAQDLRFIIACLKVAHNLERIGDYARNAAKRTVVLASLPHVGSMNGFEWMARLVQQNLKDAIDALVNQDAAAAERVWGADEAVDKIYNGIFRELLTHMMEDPRNITAATHMMFIAKNFERIGDHATNIAETVHYAIVGDTLPEDRPKSDGSNYAVVRPPAD
ncbi:phosphate signaling complex protein PhoU [Humitalea sp. 24SJ18S-53]|uniref:phosphate signaling complex protein PhoU n=1 Tax=Humitalea sp. 24SJ18S-53 TaxID=3422307 RepID=UPI003D67CEA9